MSDSIELELTGLAYGGEAIGRDAQGRMIFVPYALPDEKVSVALTDERKRWARGRLLEVLKPAAARVDAPRCLHFTDCGGCHYQHMSYEDQLAAKTTIVIDQLARLGGLEKPPVKAAIASPSPWNYRNRMSFHPSAQGPPGLARAGSNEIIPLQECHLPVPEVAELWPQFDTEWIEGLERMEFRAGAGGETMLVLHGNTDPLVELELDIPSSVVWLGPGGRMVLAGEDHLIMEVLNRPFRVSAGSFFQVNPGLTDQLIKMVMDYAEPGQNDLVFDLYAGVGLFSAFLAEAGAAIIAVEENIWAAADFEVNLDEFEKVSLYESPVEAALPVLVEQPNAIIVDPPRAGLSREVVDGIVELRPQRLVYVSCDPATLARDAKRLTAGGFTLKELVPIDLFPQTYHIETVSYWESS